MHEHVIEKAAHAVVEQRLDVLAGAQMERLALYVGQTADEHRRALRFADCLDNARHKQVRDDGREQRAGAEHDKVSRADGIERWSVGFDRALASKNDARERDIGMACDRLALEQFAAARLRSERDVGQRRRVHMPPRVEHMLAHGNGLGERPARVLERDQHQVPEGMVVRDRETVLERAGERVFRVGRHRKDAFAHVARGRHVRLLSQKAGRAAVVSHGHHGARFHAEREQGSDGHRRTRTAADDDGAKFVAAGSTSRAGQRQIAQRRESRGRRGVLDEGTLLLHTTYSWAARGASFRSRWATDTR